MRGISIVSKFALLFGFSVLPGLTQTLGEVTGRIVDSTGAAVPSANVGITNSATNVSRQTVSNGSGDYSFPSLPPAMYSVRIEHQGFKAIESPGVQVQVQQTVRLDFTLQIGQLSQSVVVDASTVQLQAENVTVGTVIDNKRIVELPLNGRNYLQLVALTPNVTTLSQSAGQAVPGKAVTARISPSRLLASAPCSISSRSMAPTTPIPISTPTSCCLPSIAIYAGGFSAEICREPEYFGAQSALPRPELAYAHPVSRQI